MTRRDPELPGPQDPMLKSQRLPVHLGGRDDRRSCGLPGPRLSPSTVGHALRRPQAALSCHCGRSWRGPQGHRALAAAPLPCPPVREARLDSALPNKPFPKLHLGAVSCAGCGLDPFKGESHCSRMFSLVRPLTQLDHGSLPELWPSRRAPHQVHVGTCTVQLLRGMPGLAGVLGGRRSPFQEACPQ